MPAKLAAFGVSFGIAALSVYLLAAGRDLLIPFAIALIVWFLIDGLARVCARLGRAPGWLALAAAIAAILAALALVVELVSGNIAAVRDAAPGYQANIEKLATRAMQALGVGQAPTIGQVLEQFDMRAVVGGVAGAAANVAGNAGLILVYVVFLLAEQRSFDRKLAALFPDPGREAEARRILAEIRRRTQAYVVTKTALGVATGIASYAVLAAVGVDLAGFWAFLIFLLNYIPTFGSLLGVVFPSLLALVQFGTPGPFLLVAAGLGALQVVVGNVIEPRLMGRSLNLSPLVVIASLATWGSIWGVTGMFLCVPLTAILMIALAEFPRTRPVAVLLSADGRV